MEFAWARKITFILTELIWKQLLEVWLWRRDIGYWHLNRYSYGICIVCFSSLMAYQPSWAFTIKTCRRQQWYYLTHNWGNRELNTFPKGISIKVNARVWQKFELTHYDVAVQYISHYAMGLPSSICFFLCFFFNGMSTFVGYLMPKPSF